MTNGKSYMGFSKNPFLDPQNDLERQQTSPRVSQPISTHEPLTAAEAYTRLTHTIFNMAAVRHLESTQIGAILLLFYSFHILSNSAFRC